MVAKVCGLVGAVGDGLLGRLVRAAHQIRALDGPLLAVCLLVAESRGTVNGGFGLPAACSLAVCVLVADLCGAR